MAARDVLEVGLDLGLRRVAPRPARVRRERELVQVRRDVAARRRDRCCGARRRRRARRARTPSRRRSRRGAASRRAPTPPKPPPTTAIERWMPHLHSSCEGPPDGRREHAIARASLRGVRPARRRRDGGVLRADRRFNDPVFGDLTGEEAGAMWRMLTGRAADLRVELRRASGRRVVRLCALGRALHVHADRPPGRQRRARRLPLRRRPDRRARRSLQLLALVAPGAGNARPGPRLDAAAAPQGRRHRARRAGRLHARAHLPGSPPHRSVSGRADVPTTCRTARRSSKPTASVSAWRPSATWQTHRSC